MNPVKETCIIALYFVLSAETDQYMELTTTNLVIVCVMGSSMLILGIATICVVKIKENREFTNKLQQRFRNGHNAHSRLDDMDEIIMDEDEAWGCYGSSNKKKNRIWEHINVKGVKKDDQIWKIKITPKDIDLE